MYTIDTCPNLGCRNCKFWNINADRNDSICKRFDHKQIKVFTPYFKSYTCGENHVICADFEPKHPEYADMKEWTNFEDFWKVYQKVWLTDCEKRGIAVTLNGDTKVMYIVPLERFLYGTMIEDGRLMAIKKKYYKQTRSGFGYKLITEEINGVKL